MITQIEALNYRCLRYIRQDLGPFHILVGPNASGKTTFLDVVAFLGRLVSDGPRAAIGKRTQNLEDLIWGRRGDRFELAIEARIPDHLRQELEDDHYGTVRYEVAVGRSTEDGRIGLFEERLLLKAAAESPSYSPRAFPASLSPPEYDSDRDVRAGYGEVHHQEASDIERPVHQGRPERLVSFPQTGDRQIRAGQCP